MSDAFIATDEVSKQFLQQLSVGDRIAARLGAEVETRSVQAVDRVSLTIRRGETLGLVGESGCGKTTLGRIVAGIMPPSAGRVAVDGEPVMSRAGRKLTTRIQTVFQDLGAATFAPIKGEIPSPLDPPRACAFHPRCPYAFAPCPVERPLLTSRGPGRAAACHLGEDAARLLAGAA